MVAHRTILASAPSPVNREGGWRWRDVARPPVSADEVGRATSDCFRTPTPMAVMAKTGTDGDEAQEFGQIRQVRTTARSVPTLGTLRWDAVLMDVRSYRPE